MWTLITIQILNLKYSSDGSWKQETFPLYRPSWTYKWVHFIFCQRFNQLHWRAPCTRIPACTGVYVPTVCSPLRFLSIRALWKTALFINFTSLQKYFKSLFSCVSRWRSRSVYHVTAGRPAAFSYTHEEYNRRRMRREISETQMRANVSKLGVSFIKCY